jgi:hypothetical protein
MYGKCSKWDYFYNVFCYSANIYHQRSSHCFAAAVNTTKPYLIEKTFVCGLFTNFNGRDKSNSTPGSYKDIEHFV